MTESLPRWVLRIYASLWKEFKERCFTASEGSVLLNKRKSLVLNYLRELKKYGWVKGEPQKQDAKKSNYYLFDPITCVEKIGEVKP